MTADEFVKKLASIAPSIKHLRSLGYSQEFAEEHHNSYFLGKKLPETCKYKDPLIHLICSYDTTKLEFRGSVILGRKQVCSTPGPDKVLVGVIEADLLVIDKKSGAVELLDHAHPDYIMAKCAASGEKFLEALLLLASFEPPYEAQDLTDELTEAQAVANNEAAHKLAVECARVAGVSIRHSIYETLLGCGCWTV